MTGWDARRIRNRLSLSARVIVAEHWPAEDGRCPICKVTDCWALATACAYLDVVDDAFVPARRTIDVVDIDSRATLPSTEATTDGEPVEDEPVNGGEGKSAG